MKAKKQKAHSLWTKSFANYLITKLLAILNTKWTNKRTAMNHDQYLNIYWSITIQLLTIFFAFQFNLSFYEKIHNISDSDCHFFIFFFINSIEIQQTNANNLIMERKI